MRGVVGRPAIIGRLDENTGDQLWIFEAGADAPFNLFQQQVGGHHQRKSVDVAVIQNLEKFFLCPGSGVLRTKVIHDKQWGGTDLFETLLKGAIWIIIGEAQGIQQIGDGDEQSGYSDPDRKVGNGSCQVSLPAAKTTLEEKPAICFLGELLRLVVGAFERISLPGPQSNASAGLEVIKGEMLKII